jgi:beta-mannosidase
MRGRVNRIAGHQRSELSQGWELAAAPPGHPSSPQDSSFSSLAWVPVDAVGPAAAVLRAQRKWSLEGAERRFDAEDWWYRIRFPRPADVPAQAAIVLGFDGLASVAEGWLNGEPLLTSDNMFVSLEISVTTLLREHNELVLHFKSLDALLEARRPRPRWRTPMVAHQRLNWFRTTLLGRTPGWSPAAAIVGPWRPVWIEVREQLNVGTPSIRTQVSGNAGIMELSCEIRGNTEVRVERVDLLLGRGEESYSAVLVREPRSDVFGGTLRVDPVSLWWPHTHGEPALYAARLEVYLQGSSGGLSTTVELGKVGFRTLEVDVEAGDFRVSVNAERIFCRGACWTPLDCVDPHGVDSQAVGDAIAQLAAAGMNMVRVGGTMVYESDAFLDACDAQGLLLWQDFMFANMDYPEGDAAFNHSVSLECSQLLPRLAARPCLAVLCGNSEGEQQAAMWGTPRERWTHALFHKVLPELCRSLAPAVRYWPSSAHGGNFPHQTDVGTVSYYGVGAYLRPLTDARRADVRFATECLALANVSEEGTIIGADETVSPKVHSPLWKARVPRDLGAGWDFDDVRDHYLRQLFNVDPLQLRYAQHDRYLYLSRIVSGEVMAATFREWRRQRSTCNGALIWFLRDLWAGAGWGVIDATGLPKAPYFFLKRLLQPRTVFLTDEGGSGVFAHLANETAEPFEAVLEAALYRDDRTRIGTYATDIVVPARTVMELPLASLFEGFIDTTYAYRFGPPPCEIVTAALMDRERRTVARDFYFPVGHDISGHTDVGLTTTARLLENGDAEVTLRADRCARFVNMFTPGFSAADQYFHLLPNLEHTVRLRRITAKAVLKGEVRALNDRSVGKIAAAK